MKMLKNYNVKYLIIILLLAFTASVVNNLRQEEAGKLEWIGGQEVLPKPEGF